MATYARYRSSMYYYSLQVLRMLRDSLYLACLDVTLFLDWGGYVSLWTRPA